MVYLGEQDFKQYISLDIKDFKIRSLYLFVPKLVRKKRILIKFVK